MPLTYRLNIPDRSDYPRSEIKAGLHACGYTEQNTVHGQQQVLVTWSPWRDTGRDQLVREHSTYHAGPIIVVENGWLQPIKDKHYWSVCLWGWNGTGTWRWSDDIGWWSRFITHTDQLPAPVYDSKGPIIIVEQRGHPTDPRTSPPNWHKTAARAINAHLPSTDNAEIRHKDDPELITEYLARLRPRGVVTWSSAAASWALLYGIPVAYAGPSIWCWELATRWDGREAPIFKIASSWRRRVVFERLAWSQWDREELASGEPFRRLLEPLSDSP